MDMVWSGLMQETILRLLCVIVLDWKQKCNRPSAKEQKKRAEKLTKVGRRKCSLYIAGFVFGPAWRLLEMAW